MAHTAFKRSALALTLLGASAWLAWRLLAHAPTSLQHDAPKAPSAPPGFALPARVSTLSGAGTAGFADGPATTTAFGDPFGLAIDAAGTLYVADAGENNRIRKIGADGVSVTLAGAREGFADGTGAQAAFNTPSGLAIDGAGNVIVADTGNNAVRKISPQGVVTTLAGNGTAGMRDGRAADAMFNGPIGVAVDNAGNVLVADTYNDRIRKIAPDGTVSTVAGGLRPGFEDGPAASALFDTPGAVLAAPDGRIIVADTRNHAIRSIAPDGAVTTLARSDPEDDDALMRKPLGLALAPNGYLYIAETGHGRILQLSPQGQLSGVAGIGIDIKEGDDRAPRLKRPSAIVLDKTGALLVTDTLNFVVRKVAPAGQAAPTAAPTPAPAPAGLQPAALVAQPAPAKPLPWPLKPQTGWHEVVGTMGEVRGNYSGENRDHFHSGVDVQGAMGVPVLAVASEKVGAILPNWGFGNLSEGLNVGAMSYIHMRVGRDVKDAPLDPARFTLLRDAKGKAERVRVKRGTRFAVGDTLGTVNRMFHVHLNYSPDGTENNPLGLSFNGFHDTIAPTVAAITLYDAGGKQLLARRGARLLVARSGGPLSIVVDAYDQIDGNVARRRLGLYQVGYQLLHADGTPLAGFEQARVTIEFNRLPPDRAMVKLAYSDKSGITEHGAAETHFMYVVTNTVRDGRAQVGNWQPGDLAPGDYLLRILAADRSGNQALKGRDLAITVE